MVIETASDREVDDREVLDEAERYKAAHPEVEEALRIFGISDKAYRESLRALRGQKFTWTNSANPMKERARE